jgi:hypothetical protein
VITLGRRRLRRQGEPRPKQQGPCPVECHARPLYPKRKPFRNGGAASETRRHSK